MKEAEQRLLDTQETKAYLGSAGDKRFAELLRPILLGEHADDERIVRPPDARRLRRAASRLRADRDGQSRRAGVRRDADLAEPSADHPRGRARDRRISLLRARAGGDPLRGHDRGAGSAASRATSPCSTAAATIRPAPTSAKTNGARSSGVVARARAACRSSTSPTRGSAAGSTRMRSACALMLDACDEVIVAQSCDKNFSVYRDRVGSLWVKTGSAEATATAMAHVFQIAREMWSMPPDHGAAAVHIILEDAELRARWLVELDGHARPHQFGAPADRRGRPAARLHRPPVRHVLDASAVARSRC